MFKYNPPKKPGLDDITNEKLIVRDDDREETVRKRLNIYKTQTKPIIEYYKHYSKIYIINGESNIESIKKEILAILEK